MSDNKSRFDTLNEIDLTKQVKVVQKNRYIAWNTAWAELCKIYPNATYEFHTNEHGLPYFLSPLGIFVKVSVTVENITHTMTRPVYNNAMKAMKEVPYQYKTKAGLKDVEPANADDINDAQMRCLTKAIAMHGLGLYIFQDKQYADFATISSEQISEISNLISAHNLMLSDLCQVFGINKLAELAEFNFDGAKKWIEDNKRQ